MAIDMDANTSARNQKSTGFERRSQTEVESM
jgi:hypothetical protein